MYTVHCSCIKDVASKAERCQLWFFSLKKVKKREISKETKLAPQLHSFWSLFNDQLFAKDPFSFQMHKKNSNTF